MNKPEILTLSIADAALRERASALVDQLVAARIASRLAARDAGLWGEAARDEAACRLGWLDWRREAPALLAQLQDIRTALLADGIDRIIVAGMGGSSLAADVICRNAGSPLRVLDTSDPGQTERALAGPLHRSVLLVASKSGGTVETDCHRRLFTAAFAAAGLDPGAHCIAISDAGSPLAQRATAENYRALILANPETGGRYSALAAFGLAPAALAGVELNSLLLPAEALDRTLAADAADNPALQIAAALAVAHREGAEKLVLTDAGGAGLQGLADWVEQLIAESTGKQGRGTLPVVVADTQAPGFGDAGADALTVALGRPAPGAQIAVNGALATQFLLWQHVVAILGHLLDINPFDQPDVEAAKRAAREFLDTAPPAPDARFGAVAVHGATGDSLAQVLADFTTAVPDGGYMAIHAYLDCEADRRAEALRPALARLSGRQTSFGWGPRFLHSTGQYHKGGHPNGCFLQITADCENDLAVPGQRFSLARLQQAQALGDGQVLREQGRPVLRLHLRDRAAGLTQILDSLRSAEDCGQL